MSRINFTARLQNYSRRLNPDRVKETLEARRDQMIGMQAVAINELGRVENEVRAVLGGYPVDTVDYMKYHNFSREVFRSWVRFTGGQGLTRRVAMLIDKYKALNCREDILLGIRDRVFAIQSPPAP
jgi:hypothetical protein